MNFVYVYIVFMVELLFSILLIKYLNGGKIFLIKWNYSIRWGDSISCILKWCGWSYLFGNGISLEDLICVMNFERLERVGLWWEEVLGKRKSLYMSFWGRKGR